MCWSTERTLFSCSSCSLIITPPFRCLVTFFTLCLHRNFTFLFFTFFIRCFIFLFLFSFLTGSVFVVGCGCGCFAVDCVVFAFEQVLFEEKQTRIKAHRIHIWNQYHNKPKKKRENNSQKRQIKKRSTHSQVSKAKYKALQSTEQEVHQDKKVPTNGLIIVDNNGTLWIPLFKLVALSAVADEEDEDDEEDEEDAVAIISFSSCNAKSVMRLSVPRVCESEGGWWIMRGVVDELVLMFVGVTGKKYKGNVHE